MVISLIFSIFSLVQAKNPITAPGDVNITNLVDSYSIELPDGSSFACTTAEADSFVSEYAEANEITANTLTVDKIIALNTEILLSGKVKINGEITYTTSLLETKREEYSTFLDTKPIVQSKLKGGEDFSSFLEIKVPQWEEIGIFDQLPIEMSEIKEHSYIQITTNVHFESKQWAGEGLMMKVDGRLAWMDSHHWSMGDGVWTSPIRATIRHSKPQLKIEFEIVNSSGVVSKELPIIDHITVYAK
ncbi:unnamed protein product [Blepharisma stoltei]|uniref:Uncharacterized protein n=1 Tax=Blepharisma stoltei TaxID=1481888 RepID=A0AAU9JNK2_9CILI|nr:unnamed protein product [Blepharisma stoltei]